MVIILPHLYHFSYNRVYSQMLPIHLSQEINPCKYTRSQTADRILSLITAAYMDTPRGFGFNTPYTSNGTTITTNWDHSAHIIDNQARRHCRYIYFSNQFHVDAVLLFHDYLDCAKLSFAIKHSVSSFQQQYDLQDKII